MSDVEPAEAGLASGLVNTSFMMGGALGLAVLASLAASRTGTLLASGESQAAALTGGYHVAFLVGAIFALVAAGMGAFLLREPTPEAAHARDEPVGEPAPCCAFTVGDQGVPEHQPEPA
jgi:MFS family permease